MEDDNCYMKIMSYLKFPDITMFHHDRQEPDDNFGARSEQHLPLASLLCIVHAFESISKTVHTNHRVSETKYNFEFLTMKDINA